MALKEEMVRLREDVDSMKKNRKEFISELVTGKANLESEVASFLKTVHNAREHAAKRTKKELTKMVSDLQSTVEGMLDGFCHDRKVMAKNTKAEFQALQNNLTAFKSELSTCVCGLKERTENLLQSYADDIAGAHMAWLKGEQTTAPKKKAFFPREEIHHTTVAKFDDLKAITGIGEGMNSRLHKLGIHTYKQLAEATSEDLHNSLGSAGKFADIDVWIHEAKKLSGIA